MKTMTRKKGRWCRAGLGAAGLMILLATACGDDSVLPVAGGPCDFSDVKQRRRCLASLARPAGGKADGWDWCALLGLYDDPDNFCDDWDPDEEAKGYCSMPDPDCGPEPDACGDTLASSGMSWSGDPNEGCNVAREQTSLREARRGNPVSHRAIDGIGAPQPSCWPDPQHPAVATLVRQQSDIGSCFDPQDPALAGVDLNREWILAVGVDGVRPGGQVQIDRIVGLGRQLRIYATVSQPDPQCATASGLDRVWTTAAIRQTKLPPGYRGEVTTMLFVETNRVTCEASSSIDEDNPVPVADGKVVTLQRPAWPLAGTVETQIEGTLPRARGIEQEGDTPADGWLIDVAAGDRLRAVAELHVPGAPAGQTWLPDLALYGPLEDGVLPSTQAAFTGRRRSPDLVEMDTTIEIGGQYLLVFDSHYDGPYPWRYRLETIRANADGKPYGFALHEPLFIGGRWRELPEQGQPVLQRYVDVELADVNGDKRLDVLLLGAGYATDVTPAQNERWLTVLLQAPTGHLVTERSFPYLEDDELLATNDGRARARMVADDVNCDWIPDVVVGGAHGLRLLLNDGRGGLAMGTKPDETEVDQLLGWDFELNGAVDLIVGSAAGLSLWYGDCSGGDGRPFYPEPIRLGDHGQQPIAIGDVGIYDRVSVIQLISQGAVEQLVLYPAAKPTPMIHDLHPISDAGLSIAHNPIHVFDAYGDGRDDLLIGVEGEMPGGQTLLIMQNDDSTFEVPTDPVSLAEQLLPIRSPKLMAYLDSDNPWHDDARLDLVSYHERGLYYELLTDSWPFVHGLGATVRSYAPEIVDLAAGDLNDDGCGDVVAIHQEGVSVFYGDGC